MLTIKTQSRTGLIAATLAFLGSWGFFLFAYPYHLMRREQQNLFLFDGDYIRQTYRGVGWLARFVSDFLEQFFVSPVPASLIVALLLTGIGVVVYRICRHFLGKWPSLAIASAFFIWAFLRETGNLYITRYTVVVLGYLTLILLALQCRKGWAKAMMGVLLLAVGAWALASPFHRHYGKPINTPKFNYERVAIAMNGRLGDDLFNHSQNHHYTLLTPASSDQTVLTNTRAGEAWFHLGDMTQAEQSSITSLQASPKHTGARFLVRLARVNLISGEDGAAMKYLNLLDRSLFYGKWARSMMPGHQDEATRAQIEAARAKLFRKDFVHQSERPRDILVGLLEADPDNLMARNYLLCYDLMCYDLEGFMQDYEEHRIDARLYREAILIWLSRHDRMTPSQVSAYGIDLSEVDRMNRFGRNPAKYKNTYWYYYMKAMYEQQ